VTPLGNTKYVARAVVDPNNQNTAYVTTSGFYGTDNGRHIYKTTNLNATTPTWTVAGVGIPDVPVNGFVIDKATGHLYAGTDIGVYRSTDSGATWESFSIGLPRVPVFDMAITANGVLRIATHGRGMWETQL
jgi:ligand-binding sensor domain-containing protein